MISSDFQRPDKVPETLYHYTDSAGLLGILESRRLWATDTLYLNDASESNYAFNLLTPMIQELMPRATINGEIFPSQLIDSTVSKHRKSVHDSSHTCIASLCEHGDLLSQWRGYTNEAVGYAVGFPASELASLRRVVLEQVIYDVEAQIGYLKSLVNRAVLQHDRSHTQSARTRFLDSQECVGLMVSVAVMGYRIKHPAFAEEAEWRARKLITSPSDISFRRTHLGITPYVELDISHPDSGAPMVSHVVVGPCPEPQLATRAVEALVAKSGLGVSEVKVCNSEIPLRP